MVSGGLLVNKVIQKKESDIGNKGVLLRDSSPRKGKGKGSPSRGSPSRVKDASERYKNLSCYFCKRRFM